MDLLVYDAKRKGRCNVAGVPVILNKEDLSETLGNRKIDAYLSGGIVQVFDEDSARVLHDLAGIGQWLDDQRKEKRGFGRSCLSEDASCSFKAHNDLDKSEYSRDVDSMKKFSPITNPLFLSPLETTLLCRDWEVLNVKSGEHLLTEQEVWVEMKRLFDIPADFGRTFAIFRFLKRNGWIVSSGHTFGCQFLIYCLGQHSYHSSAGVLISDDIEPQRLLTLTRILSHNKKALIVATVSSDVECYADVDSVEVKHVTMKTYFLGRDVAMMSSKRNEIYELKQID